VIEPLQRIVPSILPFHSPPSASARGFVSTGLFRVPEVRDRFHTLELGASVSHDGAALGRLMVRHAAAHSAGPNSTRVYSFGGTGDTDSGWSSYTWRIWWEPPSRWRADVTHPGSPTEVFVVRDDASLAYFPVRRILYTTAPVTRDGRWEVIAAPTGIVEMPTIDVFQLFHSPLPASEWVFATVAQEEIHHGRMTRRVRATRRTDLQERFGAGVDTLVQEARGRWVPVQRANRIQRGCNRSAADTARTGEQIVLRSMHVMARAS
jgi:hypothetical protein